MKFSMLDIEFCTNCCFDAVKVYDGADDSAPLLGLFCGDKLPEDLISSSNYVFVSFKSDAYTTKDGFRITYKTTGKLLVGAICSTRFSDASSMAGGSCSCQLLVSVFTAG